MSLEQIKTLLEQTINENDSASKDRHVKAAIDIIDKMIEKSGADQPLKLTWQEREFLQVFRTFGCTPGQVRDLNQIVMGLKGRVTHDSQLDALNGLQAKGLVDFGPAGNTAWITETGFELISN